MKLVTHYDYGLLKTFFQFSLMRNKKGKSRKTLFWFVSLLGLAGAIFFIFTSSNRILFVVLAGILVLVDAFVAYQLLTITKRAEKNNPAMFQAVNEYEFEAKQVIVRSLVDGEKENRIRYDDFLRAIETPTAFYLYLNPVSAFIISKAEIYEEEGEKLALLLNKKMQARFAFRKK